MTLRVELVIAISILHRPKEQFKTDLIKKIRIKKKEPRYFAFRFRQCYGYPPHSR